MWQQSLVILCVLLVKGTQGYHGIPYCEGGRDVIVHLFEWKWSDIERECPWLAANGYCAVQVSPPQEHILYYGPEPAIFPWWQRYQPVSYQIESRSGNRGAFQSMVSACNAVGVFIHVDAVIQHMTGGGSGIGSGGSSWDGGGDEGQSYPGVPYGTPDFHGRDVCFTGNMEIEDYGDAQQVRYCRLVGLRDLRTASSYVRGRLADYMNDLINMGVAGFRVDACKHTEPADLYAIYSSLNNLNNRFPASTRPFIYQEVIDLGGEAIGWDQYNGLARVTEFRFSAEIGNVFRRWEGQQLSYLRNFGEGWGFMPGMDALVFIDNHDNQRGHGPGGASVLTYKAAREYKMATAYELAWQYGMVRLMSSYAFENTEAGPPSDGNGNTNDVACFDGEWVCEHRWRQIHNMVKFHNAAVGADVVNWWDNGQHAIAFSRGNRGFIAINNEDFTVRFDVATPVPDGQYCNVYLCDDRTPPCSGEAGCGVVTVAGGRVNFEIPSSSDPVVAIHV